LEGDFFALECNRAAADPQQRHLNFIFFRKIGDNFSKKFGFIKRVFAGSIVNQQNM